MISFSLSESDENIAYQYHISFLSKIVRLFEKCNFYGNRKNNYVYGSKLNFRCA